MADIQENGEAVAEQIRRAGAKARFIKTDLRSADSIKRMVEETAREAGGLDWLADDARYENVGLTCTTTRADAIALSDTFALGLDNIAVDMLAIAQDRDRAFIERVDYMRRAVPGIVPNPELERRS